ncbi:MAG TPA: 4a-hydroxytetrahydrobiopterin dehydratase [Acidimicrobiales bacterium]|jgi:4a-hydroxytetrahydrobiopterin dehydratase|nr:4a-hydroxytetrahydrobiopterin dehydratase [Acidimicrobiales bacterium]
MSEPVLSDNELGEALFGAGGPEWELVGGRLVKTVECEGFVGSLAFVNEVGVLAEAANHHPDIDIRYNRVTLALMTHDSGGITYKDIGLAKQIDGVTVGVK